MTTTSDPDHHYDTTPDDHTDDVLLGSFTWLGRRHLLYERQPGSLILDSITAEGHHLCSALFERTGRGLLTSWLARATDLGLTTAHEQLLRSGIALRAAALAAHYFEAQPPEATLGIATVARPRPQSRCWGASV